MDVMQAIRTRRSVRSYDSRPIPDDVMQHLKDSLRLAPSACNYQPWRFILVTDPALKRALAKASMGQNFIAEAPLIVVGCGFSDRAYKHMGGYGNSIDVDLAIALDHLTLAAVAEGLGTCWIGAFYEEQVKKLLDIPADVKPVALTPVGYPKSPGLNYPVREQDRKVEADVLAEERFA